MTAANDDDIKINRIAHRTETSRRRLESLAAKEAQSYVKGLG
jgi:hypothetical protein